MTENDIKNSLNSMNLIMAIAQKYELDTPIGIIALSEAYGAGVEKAQEIIKEVYGGTHAE